MVKKIDRENKNFLSVINIRTLFSLILLTIIIPYGLMWYRKADVIYVITLVLPLFVMNTLLYLFKQRLFSLKKYIYILMIFIDGFFCIGFTYLSGSIEFTSEILMIVFFIFYIFSEEEFYVVLLSLFFVVLSAIFLFLHSSGLIRPVVLPLEYYTQHWHFLRTPVLYAFFSILLFAAVFSFLIAFITRNKRKNSIEREALIKEKNMFLHLIKHEIKGSLQAVYFILDRLREKDSKELKIWLQRTLYKIRKTIDIEDIDNLINERHVIKLMSIKEDIAAAFSSVDNVYIEVKNDALYRLPHSLLEIILFHLIENAIDATEKKKRKVEILIKGAENYVMLQVKDNGKGIKKKHINDIFQKFYTSSNRSGRGIGLFIVKSILDKIGGSINVTSELNIGSVFTVMFPAKKM